MKILDEVLSKEAPASEWIEDFRNSDDPRFAGKSPKKRRQMALAAFYAKKNESAEENIIHPKNSEHKTISTKSAIKGAVGVGQKYRRKNMMDFKNESLVEQILEEASIVDKLKEISTHLASHMNTSADELVARLKKFYVQSNRLNHVDKMKKIYGESLDDSDDEKDSYSVPKDKEIGEWLKKDFRKKMKEAQNRLGKKKESKIVGNAFENRGPIQTVEESLISDIMDNILSEKISELLEIQSQGQLPTDTSPKITPEIKKPKGKTIVISDKSGLSRSEYMKAQGVSK